MKSFWMLMRINCSDDATTENVKEAVENAVVVDMLDGEDVGPIESLELVTNYVDEGEDQPVIYWP